MARRRITRKRNTKVDPKYRNKVVTKFVNHIMQDGKKSIAEKIIYGALEHMGETLKQKGTDVIEMLEQALDNVKPPVEVRSRRVGGATYQVPVEVRPERALKLAMSWILDGAKKQHGKSMADKLAKELADAYNNTGAAIKTKIDRIKMAEANKAFANYRW